MRNGELAKRSALRRLKVGAWAGSIPATAEYHTVIENILGWTHPWSWVLIFLIFVIVFRFTAWWAVEVLWEDNHNNNKNELNAEELLRRLNEPPP